MTGFAVALLCAPLLQGIINRTKAVFAGRQGPPLVQPYFELYRLFRKGAVYGDTTTWLFRAAPVMAVATAIMALALMPFGSSRALLAFPGDFVLLAYLFAVSRVFMILAARDTGSAFEGMGSSREAFFSVFSEIALVLGLAAVARGAGSLSLSGMFAGVTIESWKHTGAVFGLVMAALFAVCLAENARIPIDDPNTHLELTMIHEVMILDHSGPDFGLFQYASALKLWIFGGLVVQMFGNVHAGNLLRDSVAFGAGLVLLSVVIGGVESLIPRLRLLYVPRLLVGAAAISALALFLVVR